METSNESSALPLSHATPSRTPTTAPLLLVNCLTSRHPVYHFPFISIWAFSSLICLHMLIVAYVF